MNRSWCTLVAACGFARLLPLLHGALIPAAVAADPAIDRDLCALIDWRPARHTRLVHTAGGGDEVFLDSTTHPGEVGGVSPPFAIQGGSMYRISGRVKRLAGDGRYKLAVGWLDADGKHISYDNSWTGQLAGVETELHTADVPAPENARFVTVHAGIEPHNACVMSHIVLTSVPDAAPAGSPTFTATRAGPSPQAMTIVAKPDTLLPVPRPLATGITLGCYYFPVMLDWDRSGWGVRKVDYLEPLLGYYDETLPEVADWHIRWAVEHGISFFVFDWYYNQGMLYLNDALEQGFLKSRHVDLMKFCLDWCNEGQCTEYKPLSFSHRSLEGFIRTVCERYFDHPSYLRIEGRPVLLIHQAWRIVNEHGGWAGCREALERMRGIARWYGHAGVYFVAVNNNPQILRYADAGFDAVTSYGYGFCDVPWGGPERAAPYEQIVPRYERAMAEARRRTKAQGLGFIPTGWLGWDDAPRSNQHAVRTSGNTPEATRPMLEMLPRYVDEQPGLALLEAWNEWGEGGAAEPGRQYGFGYLDVIRSVLAPDAEPAVRFTPSPKDIARFQTDLTFEQINDDYYRRYLRTLGIARGFDLSFEDRDGLWLRPRGQVMNVRFEENRMRCTAIGSDPILVSPPVLDLQAQAVRAIRVTMSATAGKRAELYWSSDDRRTFDASRCVATELIADGQMHTYEFVVAGHQHWTGIVRQLRFDPADEAGEIAIDRFATLP